MRNLNPSAFQSIFDHAPAALVLCDRKGRIAYANLAFSRLVGSPASVVGTLLEDSLHVSDAAGCEDARHTAVRGGSSQPLEARLRRADKPVLCRITFTAVPDENDESDSIVGAFEDVSAGHTETEALREAGERYRLAVDRANDVILNIDRSGRFTFVNPTACLLTQYSEEELVGMHFLQLVHPDAREAARSFYLNQVRRRLPSTYYEVPVVSRDG